MHPEYHALLEDPDGVHKDFSPEDGTAHRARLKRACDEMVSVHSLSDEAAKLLPELPRLIYDALRQRPADHQPALRELLEAQKRTNRLLQGIIFAGVGFVLGLLLIQLLIRIRLF